MAATSVPPQHAGSTAHQDSTLAVASSNTSHSTLNDPPNTSFLVEKEAQQQTIASQPVSAVTETAQKPSANDHAAIPNGGLQAWLQILGGFMILFNTWGLLNTFGVFQTYYESGQLFQESSSNISWIGAIQAYCVLLGGLFSGPIYDRGYLRPLLIVGSFGVVFGHMMLSLSHTFWQALLAQGFCVGLGAGCLFVPAVAVLPGYFSTRLGLAVGLAASGSSFGGIIYPIVFYRLIDQIGFGWSVRVLGFIAFATCLIPIVFMKMRVKPAKPRNLIDMSAFVDLPYMGFVVACIVGFIGLYVMLFYLSYYAGESGTTDASLSFYLVPILNAASMFGRTVPNWLSDKIGGLNLMIPGALVCGALVMSMIGVHSVGAIVVVALLFGFFSGVFIALPPVLFVQLTQDKSRIGTRIGMGFAMIGFGTLAGGPGGGAILGQEGGNLHWTSLWVYGGVTSLASGLILTALRISKTGLKLKVKA